MIELIMLVAYAATVLMYLYVGSTYFMYVSDTRNLKTTEWVTAITYMTALLVGYVPVVNVVVMVMLYRKIQQVKGYTDG